MYHWFKGLFFVLPDIGSRAVAPMTQLDKTFIWRNKMLDGYKIGYSFTEQPLDLSNFLLIRTRERLLLENKVNAPRLVLKNWGANPWTQSMAQPSLQEAYKDIAKQMPFLIRALHIVTPKSDLPVAFASNALYILERNGMRDK